MKTVTDEDELEYRVAKSIADNCSIAEIEHIRDFMEHYDIIRLAYDIKIDYKINALLVKQGFVLPKGVNLEGEQGEKE